MRFDPLDRRVLMSYPVFFVFCLFCLLVHLCLYYLLVLVALLSSVFLYIPPKTNQDVYYIRPFPLRERSTSTLGSA
jgi:hypothetical protein